MRGKEGKRVRVRGGRQVGSGWGWHRGRVRVRGWHRIFLGRGRVGCGDGIGSPIGVGPPQGSRTQYPHSEHQIKIFMMMMLIRKYHTINGNGPNFNDRYHRRYQHSTQGTFLASLSSYAARMAICPPNIPQHFE
jgi:hypothetical protein